MVRGLPGQVLPSALPTILHPLLARLGVRFDCFGGKPAAAAVIIFLTSEDFVSDVLEEFKKDPMSVAFAIDVELAKLQVGYMSPPWVRRWIGFTMNMKAVLNHDPRAERVTVNKQQRGRGQVAKTFAKVGGTSVLNRIGRAG